MLGVKLLAEKDGRYVETDEYEVDFVSLINSETFGPPPLVAPQGDRNAPRAQEGDRVLYINTDLVPAFVIERDED